MVGERGEDDSTVADERERKREICSDVKEKWERKGKRATTGRPKWQLWWVPCWYFYSWEYKNVSNTFQCHYPGQYFADTLQLYAGKEHRTQNNSERRKANTEAQIQTNLQQNSCVTVFRMKKGTSVPTQNSATPTCLCPDRKHASAHYGLFFQKKKVQLSIQENTVTHPHLSPVLSLWTGHSFQRCDCSLPLFSTIFFIPGKQNFLVWFWLVERGRENCFVEQCQRGFHLEVPLYCNHNREIWIVNLHRGR